MKDKSLVIVESPTKAKTIGKILGDDFSVVSSMGHLVDLPQKKLGVEIEDKFQPSYVVIPARKKTLSSLKKEAKGKGLIYVATDPDREGEAIGWHIKERLFQDRDVKRVVFHEITSQAVNEAFGQPRDFDMNMVEAQISRRVLDRVVGYFLSPLLWKKIARGLSAGRVQSVALKLIVEREKEIRRFTPQEYWEIEAELLKKNGASFLAKLEKVDGEKPKISIKEEAGAVASDIKTRTFSVSNVERKDKRRHPYAPFITSTLQQEAFNKLHFNASRTMMLAQQLYEGIDIGESGPAGLITYMRTDSTRVAPEAITEVRGLITGRYGKDYLPESLNVYKVKKFAQEAHEAIRPSMVNRSPDSLIRYLTPDQLKLYDLIYRRFVASQMVPALYAVTTVDIKAERYLFSVSSTELIFDGFSAVYNSDNEQEDKKNKIPPLEKDEALQLLNLLPSQHFTKPPARFSDSSLVKALEEDGIGRPSTYAPIIYTLLHRDYVRRLKGYFHPTELGIKVCELLMEYFPKIMDEGFTAAMEEELDEIEEGRMERLKVLEDFYQPFKESLDFAQNNIKKEVVETGEACPQCGKPIIIKWGRKGKFLSCSGFPECKYSKSITTGVKCPEAGCGGELIERRSKRGFFYGCTNYPKCRFVSKTLPEQKKDT
ncbi:MAG: type I DNA topoisomerase [Candidatus Omnitrophota bacterium]